jgi:dTDP-4-dehydrorhamnose 3,5-epimerase
MAVPTTEVTSHTTDIPGLLIFEVTSVGDERGYYQETFQKAKLVAAGLPESFNAYVDLRQGDSFGKTVTVEITPTTCIYLPQGVANSFQTLEDDTYYLYSVNAHWSADLYDKYCFANLGDPAIGIDWPIPLDQATLSDRDRNHPLLKDAKKFGAL